MAIELNEKNVTASVLKVGDETIQVPAGQYLQIRHGVAENPVEDLTEQCPAGKVWSVLIYVSIVETDA